MKVTTDGCLFGAWAAERVRRMKLEARTVLDIGSGTGLLSLMMNQKNPIVKTDAIEIDKETFVQASENIADSPWAKSITINNADVREFKFPDHYDVIISNPPFYENELKSGNFKKNLAHHNEGLLLPELLTIIKKNLKPEGSFFLLLPYKRNAEIRNLFTENELAIRQIIFIRPSSRHDFFRVMLEGKLKEIAESEIQIEEISIKNTYREGEAEQYSSVFTDLLKDYYLNL